MGSGIIDADKAAGGTDTSIPVPDDPLSRFVSCPNIGSLAPGEDLSSARRVGAVAIGTAITVQIAVKAKALMAEHRKAIKNRKRDFEAHHQHVHDYDAHAIAGGMMVLDESKDFKSPLRTSTTSHKDPTALISHCWARSPTSRWPQE